MEHLMQIKTIVYYNGESERESARLWLAKKISSIQKFQQYEPTRIINNKNDIFYEFYNGDTWRCVNANEMARGYRTDIAYYSSTIPDDIFYTIIKPKNTLGLRICQKIYLNNEEN